MKIDVPAAAPREKRRGEETREWLKIDFDSNETPGWEAYTYLAKTGQGGYSSRVTRTFKGALASLPRTIATATKKLGVEWKFEGAVVRPYGRKRATKLLAWLAGAS